MRFCLRRNEEWWWGKHGRPIGSNPTTEDCKYLILRLLPMYWDEVFTGTNTGGAETERQSELMLLFAREEMNDEERLRVNTVTV